MTEYIPTLLTAPEGRKAMSYWLEVLETRTQGWKEPREFTLTLRPINPLKNIHLQNDLSTNVLWSFMQKSLKLESAQMSNNKQNKFVYIFKNKG